MKRLVTISMSILLMLFMTLQSYSQTTLSYTGAEQTYTVPAGTIEIGVDIYGAGGGYPALNGVTITTEIPGQGGRLQANIAVTPGATIYIYVGGRGQDATNVSTIGGWNGGGNAYSRSDNQYIGGSGGGASDIRIGGNAIENIVFVAGGGGGAGNDNGTGENGGNGGGLIGADGTYYGGDTEKPGKGGTQDAGGAGGVYSGWVSGLAGGIAMGGDGGSDNAGGGGGGGFYGGGGGSWAGGGGGSSYSDVSATNVVHTQGGNTGNGYITITETASNVAGFSSKGIKVYPNPSNGIFKVETADNYKITVTDIFGKVIYENQNSNTASLKLSFDLSNQASGVYFIKFSNDKTVKTERIVIK